MIRSLRRNYPLSGPSGRTGRFPSYRQIADNLQHVASTDRIAVDHGDHGLGDRTDRLMQVKHIKTGHAVGIDIASSPLDILVAARTECLVAGACQYDHTYFGAFPAVGHGVEHLHVGLWPEGIVDLRAVDSDFCYAAKLFEEYVFIFFYRFPVSHICWFLVFEYLDLRLK